MGLGRAATSVVANEEGSCWSAILWEDVSSCGKVWMHTVSKTVGFTLGIQLIIYM